MEKNINKLMQEFDEAYRAERTLRKELGSLADTLKRMNDRRVILDAEVSTGKAYASELHEFDEEMTTVRERRDEISKKLQSAVERREKAESLLDKPITDRFLSLYDNIKQADANLRETVQDIQTFASMLRAYRWKWYGMGSVTSISVVMNKQYEPVVQGRDDEIIKKLKQGEIEK